MTEPKRETKKSEWMSESDSAAYDKPTTGELDGLNLLGRSSIRSGAIEGVSDAPAGEVDLDAKAEEEASE
jgi:hypothetical protein